MSGTRLNFVKPLSNTLVPEITPLDSVLALNPDLNIFSLEGFVEFSDRAWGFPLAEESYKYHGTPLWNPDIGGVHFTAELRRPSSHPNLLEAANYKHWIERDIKAYYEPSTGSAFDDWLYLLPLFWKTFKLPKTGNIQWVAYLVQNFCGRKDNQFTYFVRSAVSTEHDLTFTFIAADQYNPGAFNLFKKIARFILNKIEITLIDSTEKKIKYLEKVGLRDFTEEKSICRYDDASKNHFGNYELLEAPYFYFTKIGKTIGRRLWVDKASSILPN
ncbi:hypothetical protein ACJJI3_06320 [Microbulbifer sp. ZKSA004]|uniref:hypothetical protein n=1 Tax=Microbulbifer sp. ZKSA004 TaxID=3243389 RepID=UPI0040395E25